MFRGDVGVSTTIQNWAPLVNWSHLHGTKPLLSSCGHKHSCFHSRAVKQILQDLELHLQDRPDLLTLRNLLLTLRNLLLTPRRQVKGDPDGSR